MPSNVFERTSTIPMADNCERTIVSVLINIVGTACEHESELSMMELVNLVDLYRTYLSHTVALNSGAGIQTSTLGEHAVPVPKLRLAVMHRATFEQFIGDASLLRLAASAASRESGVPVPTPAPIRSATDNGNTRTSNVVRKQTDTGHLAACDNI